MGGVGADHTGDRDVVARGVAGSEVAARGVAAEAFAIAAANHRQGLPAALAAPPLLAIMILGDLGSRSSQVWVAVAIAISLVHNLLPSAAARVAGGTRRRVLMGAVMLAAGAEGAAYGSAAHWLPATTRSQVIIAILCLGIILFANAIYAAPAPAMLVSFHLSALVAAVPTVLAQPHARVVILLGMAAVTAAIAVNAHGLWRTVTTNLELAQRNHRLVGELTEAMTAIEVMAATDELTGAATRRAFLAELDTELASAGPFVLALVDVDHFKKVNDAHGHGVGDLVLVDVVRTLRESMRPEDVIGRVGGEEFGILLRDTQLGTALMVLDRARGAVADCRVVQPNVTISIGVAAAEAQGDRTALLAAADLALYEAKRTGRNRVVPFATPYATTEDSTSPVTN